MFNMLKNINFGYLADKRTAGLMKVHIKTYFYLLKILNLFY